MNNDYVWKVAKCYDKNTNVYKSLYIDDENTVNYELDKISYPKIGKLFCFDTLNSAFIYINNINNDHFTELILLYGKGTKLSYPTSIGMYSLYKEYWENKRKHKQCISIYNRRRLWTGTVLVSSFLPLYEKRHVVSAITKYSYLEFKANIEKDLNCLSYKLGRENLE